MTKLTHMTFRDPHGISKVTPLCPEVNDVKIIYNVFEFNYDSNVDNCLVDLELFPKYRAGGKILINIFLTIRLTKKMTSNQTN